jgi:outer membrane protein TolC
MKKRTIILLLMAAGFTARSQVDTITLDYCYKQAEKNYPLAGQRDLLDRASSLRISNLNKNYLPLMNMNGSASLQSDVTYIQIPLPPPLPEIGMPKPATDQYKLTVDVNQSIWDGNVTSYQKKVEKVNLQNDQKSLQVQLYQLKDQINIYYLSIFLFQENIAILNSSKEILQSKLREVRSAVANGTQLQSTADALDAEIVQIDQQLITLRSDRATAFSMLSELTSVQIPETAYLVLPVVKLSGFFFENRRFENDLYNIQMDRTEIQKNMVTTKWNPKFYAFGELGYGRPGFNFLDNDFVTFWIFGGKLTWNFYNWGQNKNEKKIYGIQKEIINTQKESFDKNIRIANDKNVAEVLKLAALLEKDQQMIDLRSRIRKTASFQLDNGVITSSEYVNRVDDETQAKSNMELHRLQLIRAKLAYLYNLGKL